jgi:4-amino-4-deoxy-L-arabinose transferase-like glycosyltransferase
VKILIVAFVLRAVLPLAAWVTTKDKAVFHNPDTQGYVDSAMSLLRDGRFEREGMPEILRTPGYPLLLIPGLRTGNVELVTICLQILISCFTVYLVYKITAEVFRTAKGACFGAGLYAVEPLSIMYCSYLLTETFFAFLLVMFLYLMIRWIHTQRVLFIILAAAVLAASAYVRPISYYLPALVTILVLVWTLLRRESVKRKLIHCCLFFVVSMSMIGLWQVRNYVLAGYSGFSAIREASLYGCAGAAILAAKNNIPLLSQQQMMLESYGEQHPEHREWSRVQVLEYQGREGARLIRDNLGLYAKIHLRSTLLTILGPGVSSFLHLFGSKAASLTEQAVYGSLEKTVVQRFLGLSPLILSLDVLLGAYLMAVFLLAIIGLARCINKVSVPDVVFLLACAGYVIIIVSGQGYSRFRHPAMPVVCVFAGYGLATLLERFRNKSAG